MSRIQDTNKPMPARAPLHSGLFRTLALIVLVALLPVISLIFIAFTGDTNELKHLATTVLPQALQTTIALMVLVAGLTASIGVVSAWLIAGFEFPFRRTLAWMLVLPIAIPPYLAAYSFVEFLHFAGPLQTTIRGLFGFQTRADYWFPEVRSVWGAALILSLVLYPYVYLATRVVFLMQGRNAADVARSLGASTARVFFKVLLPMSRPAIIAGVSLALMETLNDIGAVEYLGVRTLTFSVYNTWLGRGSLAGAAQIAVIMLIFVMLLLWLELYSRRLQRFNAGRASNMNARPSRLPLKGGRRWMATILTALPVLAGFGIPFAVLLQFALKRLNQLLEPVFLSALKNSILVGGATAIMTVMIALFMLHSGRLLARRGTLPIRLASSGYAVPGTVMALGLLYVLTSVDTMLNMVTRGLFDIPVGLIFSGSAFAVILAATIRFLAVAETTLASGLQKLPANLDAAARNLGHSPLDASRFIMLPLLRPAIITGLVLVFVDTIKELSATILLRPIGFNTLSTLVYENASRAAVEEGAVAALAIVMTSLVPVFILSRALTRDNQI